MKDLLLLDQHDEQAIADALSTRYEQGDIYTFLGPVLIVLNPYKTLHSKIDEDHGVSAYDSCWVDRFRGTELHLSSPHPFAIAEAAYADLIRYDRSQFLLITGESGSGKTETSKHLMQYIADVTALAETEDSAVQHISNTFCTSNAILEAFGNAQTIRNNNSSRFGKHIVLQFDFRGKAIGGFIQHYVLEKSRVNHQAPGERNFHAFYHLLSDCNERDRWHLMPANKYRCIRSAQIDDAFCTVTDDVAGYIRVRESMEQIGFSTEDQASIYQLLASILWIGNIVFQNATDASQNLCATLGDLDDEYPSGRDAAKYAADLLGLPFDSLLSILTSKTLCIKNVKQKITLDAQKADGACRSLAKCLYEKLFDWIVLRINKSMKRNAEQHVANCIGILDIYGFEIFPKNAFEQLCINYVSEKLQQLFIAQTLEAEQIEYKQEGIAWEPIEYTNNQTVCDLLDNPRHNGIFPLLDEQCALNRFSEMELIEKCNAAHHQNPHYIKARLRGPTFIIAHYAGAVEYDVSLFFETNLDYVHNDLLMGIRESTFVFVRDLFAQSGEDVSLKRPPTSCYQFRNQMQLLLKTVQGCHPHYIRCIKPNADRAPLVADKSLITEQVHYLGLAENLKIRKKGFCYRDFYLSFLDRYKILSSETWPKCDIVSAKQATKILLGGAALVIYDTSTRKFVPFEEDSGSLGSYSLGRTKIFIRHPEAISTLEKLRWEKLCAIADVISAFWRRFQKRILLAKYQAAYRSICKAYRDLNSNCFDRRMRRNNKRDKMLELYRIWNVIRGKLLPSDNTFTKRLANFETENVIIFAQSFVRCKIARCAFLRHKSAQIIISKYYRGWQTRKRMPIHMKKACHMAILGIRSEYERFLGKKKRRRDTLDRQYTCDYIGIDQLPAYHNLLKSKPGGSFEILFAAEMIKVNRKLRQQERILLITDAHIYNIRAYHPSKPKERRRIELPLLEKVSMSTFPDNYLVFHPKGKPDMLVQLHQKSELVLILINFFRDTYDRELRIEFTNSMQVSLAHRKRALINFIQDRSVVETQFKKNDRANVTITVGWS